ncbi:DNA adenine methylase [Nitratireductor rhodophyticola]|uniref:DNA adenine methylase n=1 Tax=Nitratireductor rhodophyticola TaxID=2854036 RepID=UPI003BACFD67
MTQQALKPFLKWAGGKRWLFESGQFSLPNFTGRYIEPFLGGGAVFFENQPKNAVLSDSNRRLIELFTVIRDELEEFEELMRMHAKAHSKSYYYELRSKRLRKPSTRAAQFLYLNRTCWNGLYRENLKGQFNVPIGTKQTVIFETDDFLAWSRALQGTRLIHRDFENAIDEAEEGDFVFVDPPYTVRHNMNGFVKYNQNIFAWHDQVRLRDALRRASDRGVSFAMTNADHESIRELYAGFGEQRQLGRYSVIAGKSVYRGQSTELLIMG